MSTSLVETLLPKEEMSEELEEMMLAVAWREGELVAVLEVS